MLTFIQGVFKPHFEQGVYIQPAQGARVRLAKVFNSQGASIDPELPKFFNVVESVNPTSLKQVGDLLNDYETSPDIAMIRATPVSSHKNVRRTTETFNSGIRSRIIHMDIDGIDSTIDGFDIESQGRYCISLLNKLDPDVFPLDAGFVAKASGSAGIKKGIRMHVYMKANQTVANGQMKWYSTQLNKKAQEELGFELLDTSVYDRVHMMYTANPIFEDISMNPFEGKERTVICDGTEIT